ncbi:MAG: putative metal-binding motif-containing protein [Sandaracinaceae bacterium]|nr:putative metal-binding motif-containing protein [Sandaracinaceae bacterium]
MSKLRSCSVCAAFLPEGASECPVCEAPARSILSSKPLRGLFAAGAGSLLAMTLSACYGAPIDPYSNPWCPDPATDLDGDNYCSAAYDCNESDPSVHVGASDALGDGIDQNCDGVDGYAGDAGM